MKCKNDLSIGDFAWIVLAIWAALFVCWLFSIVMGY
jgi:hypothetical protein